MQHQGAAVPTEAQVLADILQQRQVERQELAACAARAQTARGLKQRLQEDLAFLKQRNDQALAALIAGRKKSDRALLALVERRKANVAAAVERNKAGVAALQRLRQQNETADY